MKIKQFFWNRINGLKTFPVAHLILLFLTGCSTYFIHIDQNETRQIKLIVAGILGFLVSLIWPLLTLHAEEETKTIRIINRITQLFALPTIAGYYRLLQGLSENTHYAENLLYFWIFPLLILGILTLIEALWSIIIAPSQNTFPKAAIQNLNSNLPAWWKSLEAIFSFRSHWSIWQYSPLME